MAFETGTATDLADLISKLSTFATVTVGGWVEDERDNVNGRFALHKTGVFGDIYVSFRWDVTTPQHLSVHQALGYTGGNEPGAHPDDSGNGYNDDASHADTDLDDERHVNEIGDGPFESYHFFEDDHYLHVVVQVSSGVYRHFGFGLLLKSGDWTGGEYAYGCRISQSPIGADSSAHVALIDGVSGGADSRHHATVHAEGLPGQAGASKWGVAWGTDADPGNDTAGNPREILQGGFRAGPVAAEFGSFSGSALTGNVPMYSITVWHRHGSNPEVRHLGDLPDVRALNIKNFQPGEEVSIGGDTWVIFPLGLKSTASVANRTFNSGIAYKKVTA